MNASASDRRKFPRVTYPCLVKITAADSSHEPILSHTENISLGGICVTLQEPMKLFANVDLEIDLLDVEEHIKPKGKIVWCARRKSEGEKRHDSYDVGVEFFEISGKDRDLLMTNIQALKKSGAQVVKPFV
ncbi:MAG: PilZ domain-containing protein [Candidatus Omnitrophica bacterium]|nr:PilZ domain-containing protein [Candidatus Omnitrophota bacterium]